MNYYCNKTFDFLSVGVIHTIRRHHRGYDLITDDISEVAQYMSDTAKDNDVRFLTSPIRRFLKQIYK